MNICIALTFLLTGATLATANVVPEVCMTEECTAAAAMITGKLDHSVEPCDDFYEFACGNWRKKTAIPDGRSSISTFYVLNNEVKATVKALLEEKIKEDDIAAINKAKNLYKACMNESLIEFLGKNVVVPLLEELGGWPVLGTQLGGNWEEGSFNLQNLLVTSLKYNKGSIINIAVGTDLKNSTERIIYLNQPPFGMPGRKYLIKGQDDEKVQAYQQLATDIAVLFGADPTVATNDMKEMVAFEIELATISTPDESFREMHKIYNKMSASELADAFSSTVDTFNWMNYLQDIMNLPPVPIPIIDTEPLIVPGLPYFSNLFGVITNTPNFKRVIANYVVWRILQDRIVDLGEEFRNRLLLYDKVLYGTSTAPARWQSCVSYVNSGSEMGLAVGRMFIAETFKSNSKDIALAMISNLRNAFIDLLPTVNWMDEKTRALAQEKVEAIQSWIGFPDNLQDDVWLDTEYADVVANPERYMDNIIHSLQRNAIKNLVMLREKVDKNEWKSTPAMVNAFYSPTINRIIFPAGILQPPFYGYHQPKSINYGAIGLVIGHEITHAFDDTGRQFDKNGNIVQWWSDEAIATFKDRADCIINQYGNYTVPEVDLNVNGINTQGENIADNGGVKQSFKAYRRWVDSQGKEERRLPGVDFSHNQLFFISFAQVFCKNSLPERAIHRILTDTHSPARFRVIGALQNSDDFAEAFNCPTGSYMNPPSDKKCQVW